MTDLATDPDTDVEPDVEVDAELLEEAQRQIAAPSPNAAINEALRRLVEQERQKRQDAHNRLREMYEAGDFDFSQLKAAEE